MNLQHQQLSPGGVWETAWSRNFGMGGLTPDQWQQEWVTHLNQVWLNPPSNRLTHLESRRSGVANPPIVAQTHFFDDNGNLIRENNARHFEWDYGDRMRAFRTQTGNVEPTVHAHYLYDASGQRVKKLVRKQGGQVEVTVYIDGIFEYQRIVQGEVTRENNTLHVMDDQSRIALVRVGNPFPDDTTPAVKFHLGDHLGSSNVVIDEAGNWLNREEYTPYGETSFGSFARKRYRFTGKERDEESGLCYFGARYYSPWCIRWMGCDPAGTADTMNLYTFVQNNPVGREDPSGRQSQPSKGVDSNDELVANIAKGILQESAPVELPPLTQKEQDSQAQLESMAYDKTHAPKPNEVRVTLSVTDRAHMKQLDDLALDPPGHPAEAKSFKPGPAGDLRLRLEQDYPNFVDPQARYVNVSQWQRAYVADGAIHFTGIFVLAGKEGHKGPVEAAGYGMVGYSQKHGAYLGVIGEVGLKHEFKRGKTELGEAALTTGFEAGVGTGGTEQQHFFAEPTNFALYGTSELGFGIAWEPKHMNLKELPPPLVDHEGEYSPFFYFPFYGANAGIGLDIKFRDAGY